ncbi:hypothetical protein ACOME3_007900 [Neoechinorhynchus agilis]
MYFHNYNWYPICRSPRCNCSIMTRSDGMSTCSSLSNASSMTSVSFETNHQSQRRKSRANIDRSTSTARLLQNQSIYNADQSQAHSKLAMHHEITQREHHNVRKMVKSKSMEGLAVFKNAGDEVSSHSYKYSKSPVPRFNRTYPQVVNNSKRTVIEHKNTPVLKNSEHKVKSMPTTSIRSSLVECVEYLDKNSFKAKALSPPSPPPLPGVPIPPPMPTNNDGTKAMSTREMNSSIRSDPCLPWRKLEEDKLIGTIWETCRASLVRESTLKAVLNSNEEDKTQTQLSFDKFNQRSRVNEHNDRCLDTKKAYNLAIIVGGLKRPISAIVEAFKNYDSSVMSTEVLQHLFQYGPNSKEIKSLKEVDKPEKLELPDRLAFQLLKVNEYDKRLKTMIFQSTFKEMSADIELQLNDVSTACSILSSSTNIKQLIEFLLIIGNFLNKDNPKYGQAKGFDIEILSKIADLRIHSKKTSLLSLLVKLSNQKLKCQLTVDEEIQALERATTIDMGEIDYKMSEFKHELEICQELLHSLQKSNTHLGKQNDIIYPQKLSDFIKHATEELILLRQRTCQVKSELASVKRYFGLCIAGASDEPSHLFFQTFRDFLVNFIKKPANQKSKQAKSFVKPY